MTLYCIQKIIRKVKMSSQAQSSQQEKTKSNWEGLDSDHYVKINNLTIFPESNSQASKQIFSTDTPPKQTPLFEEYSQTIGGVEQKYYINVAQAQSLIEPWLSALFQADHLSLLVGSGLTTSVCYGCGVKPQQMEKPQWNIPYKEEIEKSATITAKALGRVSPNIEDYIREAQKAADGLRIIGKEDAEDIETGVSKAVKDLIEGVLESEREILNLINGISRVEKDKIEKAQAMFRVLEDFLLSFTSRTATKDRINIFTTNYDRLVEYAADDIGLLILDRFRGILEPIFRDTRLDFYFHYSPPGIRGEPRYVEGVARLSKIHGSLDWRFRELMNEKRIVRTMLPFGAEAKHPAIANDDAVEMAVIYPRASKDIETSAYPYAELFRDLSNAICRPNSVLVLYGYGFGDSHINRIIAEMLTIPSTHLVLITYSDPGADGEPLGRAGKFISKSNFDQVTVLKGTHFGDLVRLTNYYLPKSAIDRIGSKLSTLLANRNHSNLPSNDRTDVPPTNQS